MLYAITGATGFVGAALTRLLRESGHEVVALVRDPARATHLTDLGVSLVEGDLDDQAALTRLCTDVDGLFHVAGWYRLGSRHPDQGRRTNVEGTRNVMSVAREAKVPRVVYTSTLAVNSDTGGRTVDESYAFTGRHVSAYDETKAQAHEIAAQAAAHGLPVVTVMPGLVGMHEHLFYPTPKGGSDGLPMYGEMADSAPRLYLAAGVTTARTAGSMA